MSGGPVAAYETFVPAPPCDCLDDSRRPKRLPLRIHPALVRALRQLPAAELEQIAQDVKCPKCRAVVYLRLRDLVQN